MVSPSFPWREGVRGREVMQLVICFILTICVSCVKFHYIICGNIHCS